MGVLNFVLFTAMVNQPDVLIAVARENAFRIWWIVDCRPAERYERCLEVVESEGLAQRVE